MYSGITSGRVLNGEQKKKKRKKKEKKRDVCKTLTSRPLSMKHLPISSPYLVHNEAKSFGSIPSTHPVHDETKSFGSTPLPHPLDATAKI